MGQDMLSMEEFNEAINQSFRKIREGDIISGIVIGITDAEVILDLNYYAEGIIKASELSNDPRFSIKADIQVGDKISAMVIHVDDGHGNILLSMKKATDVLAWKKLKEYMENKTILEVKLANAVNGGIVTYLEGIRGFVPASQVSLSYVEDLGSWEGKTIKYYHVHHLHELP